MPVSGCMVGKQICEALGIDSTRVRSIVIRIVPSDAVTVTVERFVEMTQIDQAVTELVNERYELQRRETQIAETAMVAV